MLIVSNQKERKYTILAELANASVIVISEMKLDGSVLNRETVIEGYDFIRLGSSRKGSGVACFMKFFITYRHKANMRLKRKFFLQRYIYQSKTIYNRYPT